MHHSIVAEDFGVRLRPVQMTDASFIVWLRNQDHVKGRVGDSAVDVVGQNKWLETYFERRNDFYFVLETLGGTPLGTNALYEMSGQNAEWGRYIVRPEVRVALSSAILVFDLAFEKLKICELLARCVSTNTRMHSIVKKCGFSQTETRLSNQIIGGQPVDMIHFVLKAGDWPQFRERLLPLAHYARTHVQDWEQQLFKTGILQPFGMKDILSYGSLVKAGN